MFRAILAFLLVASVSAFVSTNVARKTSISLQMSDEFSASVPFLKKNKNLAGLVVSQKD